MDVSAMVDVEWYLDIDYVVDYFNLEYMNTNTLNRGNEISAEIGVLESRLFMSSRKATRFTITMNESKYAVDDDRLNTALLMAACNYYDTEIARLKEELKRL